jgi:hypothetical protein
VGSTERTRLRHRISRCENPARSSIYLSTTPLLGIGPAGAASADRHHTPSPHCQEMFEAVVAGATDPEIEGVEVVRRPALTVSPVEMLEADGYLLGTPANLGYSDALKHAFDQSYYQLLDSTRGRPFGLWLHGNEGTEGAERAVDGITAGLGWVKAAEYVVVSGKPTKADVEACWNLGATVAAQLMGGVSLVAGVAELHHTVPRFYLRGFANDAERITTVRLPGDNRYTQTIGRAAATNHFYSIDGHPQGPDVFERTLSQLEGDAASVLRAIEDGAWPLSEEQRETLGTFMAVQIVRGPDHRRTMEYLAAQTTRLEVEFTGRENVQQWVQNRYGVELDDEEAEAVWQQATQPGGPPITIAPIAHIDQIVDSAAHLLPYIISRPWKLVRFSRRSLVTCDSPVGLVPTEDTEPWQGVGFATAWGITFPLTRKLGLIMSDIKPMIEFAYPVEQVRAGRLDSVESGTTATEKFINESTVRSASEYVYHHPDDEGFLPTPLPEPRLSNLSIPGYDEPDA